MKNDKSEYPGVVETDLTATMRKLEKLLNQAESTQNELTSQVEKLQLKKDSLNSKFQTAQSQVDEAKARENAMKKKVAALESEVTILRSELARAHESKSDNNFVQTEHKEKADIDEQAVEEIEPSTEVTAQEGQAGINVEDVEEPELKLENQAQPKVAPAHSAEVTAKDVQAADFKDSAERIVFSKALFDFASRDATIRADAAVAIAGIRHELSLRILVAHIADEPSAYVRQECIKALTALGNKDGIGTLDRALADEAASVRLAVVWGLYRLAGTESIPALTRMLSDDDEGVRRRAVTCIGWLAGQVGKAGNHRSDKVVYALIQCLNDPSISIKNAVLDTLQTVTGKKMSGPRTSPERLIKQWQKWWKAELLGQR